MSFSIMFYLWQGVKEENSKKFSAKASNLNPEDVESKLELLL